MPIRCRWSNRSPQQSCLSMYPLFSLLFARGGLGTFPREIVSDHCFIGLRPLEPILVTHRQMNVAHAGTPVLDHADMREIIILGGGFVVLAAVDQMHHRDG